MTAPKHGFTAVLLGCLWFSFGCTENPSESANAQTESRRDEDRSITVDIATAETQSRSEDLTYSGTTEPKRRVSVRARSDGQLVDLVPEAGDFVFQGQAIAQIENNPLLSELAAAEAEVGARLAEVEEVRNEKAEARSQVEEIRAELQQARVDARRFQGLADDGAVPRQDAEVAQTQVRTLEQRLQAAQDQVQIRDRAIDAAQRRVDAQQALVEGIRQRLAYTDVLSPLNGVVLQRILEPGDIVQTGDEILELGDFSEVEVRIEVPDRDRAQISVGQAVDVTLDAFPDETFLGRIDRIFPIADPVARLIPVKIVLDTANLDNTAIASGLLARVTINTPPRETVWIPNSALEVGVAGENTVFVVSDNAAETPVEARSVQIGDRQDGQVEITEGLAAGDRYVVRSDRPLTDGQTVKRSFLSQP